MANSAQDHINQIRRDKYGLDENGRLKGVNPLASDLHDSIEHLSEGLYSRNAHFIFELIQNAEDNTYTETEANASLCFELVKTDPTRTPSSNGAVIIRNNEIGFSPDNVNAICAVGKSTKSKTQGYIGEKGIGFKSVFKVTTNPHIFSNGYSFCLPEIDEETRLGYIVPQWIDIPPKGIDLTQTTIILPLDKKEFNYEKIETMLREIEPETILFLSKLKQLKIITDTEDNGDNITIYKDDSEAPFIHILVEGTWQGKNLYKLDEFLFYAKSFDKPPEITHEKRIGIDQRDVSIAFPIGEDKESAGKIFAYLPVQPDTGLPFIINADFILTSNREDVLKDEPWNQWLLDCVSDVFIEAFEKWLDAETYRTKIFGFIPLGANNDFLKPVVDSIQSNLKNHKIILTEPDGQKRMPEQTMTAPKDFRLLLSTSTFPKPLLDTRIVLSELEIYRKQIEFIGVKTITLEIVKKCFQDRSWIGSHDEGWLLECYQFLSKQDFSTLRLTDCPIVPVEVEGKAQWSCDDEQPIYFELDDECKKVLDEKPVCACIPLAFLNSNFFAKIKDDEKLCTWMTETLKIYPFSKNNYAVDILMWLKEHYSNISESDLISTTVFLLRLADTNFDFKDIPIVLSDGRRMLLSEALALQEIQMVVSSSRADSETGWHHIWKTKNDRSHFLVLSNCYPEEVCESFFKKDLILLYPKPFYRKDIGYYHEYYDYLPPEWMKDDNHTVSNHEASALIQFLEKNSYIIEGWPYCKHDFRNDGRCNFSTELKEASFIQYLKKLRWLPTTKGLAYSGQAFLPSPDIKDILGDSVPYFQGSLQSNIIDLLGIRTKATVEELMSVLEQHSQNGDDSKELAERVYRTLDSRDLSENIKRRLRESNLILAAMDSKFGWVNYKDVVWKDQKDVMGDDFIFLENTYPKLKNFFVNIIGVKEDFDTEVFARRWIKLQNESSRDNKEIEGILTSIYRKIRPVFDKEELPAWWQNFADKVEIWTQDKMFKKPQSVYVPDDGDLKQVFQGNGIAFVWRPEKDSFSDWEALYSAIGIKYLSESVKISLVEDNQHDVPDHHAQFLTDSAKILIATWIREQYYKDFDRLIKSQVIDALLNTSEACVFSLNVNYLLDEKSVVNPSDCFWDKEQKVLLTKDQSGERTKNTIARTLARAMMPNRAYKEFADWIELVLTEQDYRWRIQQKSWQIPMEVRNWMENLGRDPLPNKPSSYTTLPVDNPTESIESIKSKPNPIIPQNNIDSSHESEKEDILDSMPPLGSLPPQPPEKDSPERSFDYDLELVKSFNRSGETKLKGETSNEGNLVKDPERRIEKETIRQADMISAEPDPEKRRWTTERTILEGPDEQVRKTLEEWYGGKCQICDSTFPERDGRPFFIAKYMVERKLARQVDTYANAICLCAEHFAKWQHGAVVADNISSQINSLKLASEGGDENLQLKVKLCGEECVIKFKKKHVIALQGLMNAYDQNDVSYL